MDDIDLEDILRRNPKIDADKIKAHMKKEKLEVALDKFRGITSPYEATRLLVEDAPYAEFDERPPLRRYERG